MELLWFTMFLVSRARPDHKTDNFTAIYERTVYKMWEPRRLTALRASTRWYRGSALFYFVSILFAIWDIWLMR
jgi:hypothetical protein